MIIKFIKIKNNFNFHNRNVKSFMNLYCVQTDLFITFHLIRKP